MNAEEQQALKDRVRDLVGEHCNAFVFVANVDDESLGVGEEVIIDCFDGGQSQAIGLLELLKHRHIKAMLDSCNRTPTEDEGN